jgi:dienelactone hydrolase
MKNQYPIVRRSPAVAGFAKGLLVWVLGLALLASALHACDPTTPPTEPTTEQTTTDASTTESNQSKPEPKPEPTPEPQPEPAPITIRASGPNKAIDPGKWGPYDVSTDAPKHVQDKIKAIGLPPPVMPQDAYRNAKPLRSEGPYPVILFSHGSGGIRFQSVFQTPHLASHGYVVISPDHHGNTLYDLFINPNAQDPSQLAKAASNRPLDMKFSMEQIKKRVETEGELLYGLAKFDKVGITGHSFGGMTSVLVTRILDNLAVIIPQAPHTSLTELLGVKPEHLYDMPAMVLAAVKDNTLDYQNEQKGFFDKLLTDSYYGEERHLVSFTKGGHFTFSNICQLDLKKYADKLGFGSAANLLNDGCADHNTPIQEAHKLINHYATAMFNVILRNSEPSREYLKQLSSTEITYTFKAKP